MASRSRSPSPRRDGGGERRRPRNGGDSYRPGGGRPSGENNEGPAPRRSPPRRRSPVPEPTAEEKQAAAKAEYEKLLNARSGGLYIPPARLRALQAQITDKTSKEYQKMAWEALKKSINGLINKVNIGNIKAIVPEVFNENLIRGRGLFCRSVMKAQASSLPFTPIYAAFAAIINSKLPQVGELLVKRLIMQFRKAFRRNDKAVCLSSAMFIAHLVNQQVVHEMLAAQMLLLLLQKPTDDSVEIAVGLLKEVGAHLEDMNPAIANAVYEQARNILHTAEIETRTQYMVEVLFEVRKNKYKDNPAVKEELDLLNEEDMITHRFDLDAEIDVQDTLNIFKFDADWEENEAAYKKLRAEILGEGSDYSDDDEDDEDESSDEEEDQEQKAVEIKDQSNTDLVNLRRTIYLTIMSSIDPEEGVHKLMRVNLPPGQEPEMPSMIVECCSQEKTYTKYFGFLAERFSKINRMWQDLFEKLFAEKYLTIHRYETNRLRNVARIFGHLFGTDAIGWHALSCIHLNEDETTSASRIFIKIMFQEMSEEMGMVKLQQRMKDETLQPYLEGLFPHDNPRNIRFSINYFTSIGMGALTEEMREFLANMPKPALPAPAAADHSDSDSVSSYSSYTGSSYSSRSRSRTPLAKLWIEVVLFPAHPPNEAELHPTAAAGASPDHPRTRALDQGLVTYHEAPLLARLREETLTQQARRRAEAVVVMTVTRGLEVGRAPLSAGRHPSELAPTAAARGVSPDLDLDRTPLRARAARPHATTVPLQLVADAIPTPPARRRADWQCVGAAAIRALLHRLNAAGVPCRGQSAPCL
ncbi:U2-type spliceosomal complex subunit CWC22 [Apiospora arundinis]